MPNRLTKGQALVGKLRATTIVSSLVVLPYAAVIALEPLQGGAFETTTIAATGNATINANDVGIAGQEIRVIVINDPTLARTITFGTNFRPNSTLIGTISKAAVVTFVSDGVSFFECSRQTGL